ncbi:hypothetical protein [Streptomyces glomeratus]|uniref:Uncharacterized protein n=1 Tax=Streptomyces glomeratus TaxID=284452 RepID=A0ABP6L3Y2_9ACTN|nr:hypothetical protein [Streptomyces glomeratus]MCF1509631.1 hypothetical protein [Streptomyces glomeratus]
MSIPHEIDRRAAGDPRNRYMSDEQFYRSDRPLHPVLPEDRPRGGAAPAPMKHRGAWSTVLLIVCIFLLIAAGIALFP